MYNMSMLSRWFSNELWGDGGALNHLPLLFCKSVYSHIDGYVMHGFVDSYSWFIFMARENLDASLHIHIQLTKKHFMF